MTSLDQASATIGLVAEKILERLSRLEVLAFCALFISVAYTCITLAQEPPFLHPGLPHNFSMIYCVLFSVFFVAVRLMVRRKLSLERLSMAVFLGGMPFVYIWSALLHGEMIGVLVEVAGGFIFVGLAVWGFKGFTSPWMLGLGITAHGLAWDSWHHDHTVYIAYWYPMGCLLIDIALGFLVLTQWAAHQVGAQHKSPSTRPIAT